MVIGVVKLEVHISAKLMLSHDRWDTWLDGFSQLDLSHTLLKLVAIVLAKVEIKIFLISLDHLINEWRDTAD